MRVSLLFMILVFVSCAVRTNPSADKKRFSNESTDRLIRFFEDEEFELGTPCGYVNNNGDTVIPIGRYVGCYTDTITSYGVVIAKGRGFIGIDAKGNELYQIYPFDNGPDDLSEGLFRILVDDKIGFADSLGKIVIQPQFQCAEQFRNGTARVADTCTTFPVGEHNVMVSNTWKFIDRTGNVINDSSDD